MPFLGHSTTHPLSRYPDFSDFPLPLFYRFELSVHKETLVASRPRRRSKRATAGGRYSATRPYRNFFPLSSNDPKNSARSSTPPRKPQTTRPISPAVSAKTDRAFRRAEQLHTFHMTACRTQADHVPERPPDFRDNRTPLTATSLHDEKAVALAEILAVASASSLTTIYVSHSLSAFLSVRLFSPVSSSLSKKLARRSIRSGQRPL